MPLMPIIHLLIKCLGDAIHSKDIKEWLNSTFSLVIQTFINLPYIRISLRGRGENPSYINIPLETNRSLNLVGSTLNQQKVDAIALFKTQKTK